MCSQIIKKKTNKTGKRKKQAQICRQFTSKSIFEVSFGVKKAGT
jgi:hypothetical protein